MDDFEALWARQHTTAMYVTHNLAEAMRLADRILVLGRRPGHVRATVTIPVPRPERREAKHADALAPLQDQIWHLIRSEAVLADREMNTSN
jgi:NitT/TauT family transport system ATP-binding protein